MSVPTHRSVSSTVVNVPNQLTAARLVLAVVLFVLLECQYYVAGLVLFAVAAATDWVDGYWARKYGQVTVLGRILDPFADKIIVCGSFIFLAADPDSLLRAWMAVVVVGRELLVTALRSFLEERGTDFSATTSGKWKMVVQCVTIAMCLFRLSYRPIDAMGADGFAPVWLTHSVTVLVWASVVITVYSGIGYVLAAIRLLRK